MIANMVSQFFFCRIQSSNKHLHIQFAAVIMLFLFLFTGVSASPEQDKIYLRIQKEISSESDDLEVISIGGLVLKDNKFGHADLSSLKSDMNGSAVTLDLGGGFAFNWNVSLFLGLGISLGYNTDYDDTIAAYYPEAGAIWDITKKFGITVSAKRYYNLYQGNEDLVMFGLVFRN
jgi:hypothetical protein